MRRVWNLLKDAASGLNCTARVVDGTKQRGFRDAGNAVFFQHLARSKVACMIAEALSLLVSSLEVRGRKKNLLSSTLFQLSPEFIL